MLKWIIGVVVIIAIGGGIFLVTRPDESGSKTDEARTGEQAAAGATKTACDIYTPAIARQILGEGVRKSDLPVAAQTSTDDVSVSQCMYEIDDGVDLVIANILVRGAKHADAYETNTFGFNDTRNQGLDGAEAASEPIDGLGDEAYYNPSFEQVNVLINDGQYWIIVHADNGREATETLAREVVKNL